MRKFEKFGGNQQVVSDTGDSGSYGELNETPVYLVFHSIRNLLRLLPLNRCIARFCVVSWAGEPGLSLLSYRENRVVTM